MNIQHEEKPDKVAKKSYKEMNSVGYELRPERSLVLNDLSLSSDSSAEFVLITLNAMRA